MRVPCAITLGLGLTASLLSGCLTGRGLVETDEAGTRTAHTIPLTPAAQDVLFLQTVLIEQSLGDTFLDDELWQTAPSAVPAETRALLAENGLRAAIISGNPPARFLDLLTSELATVNPQILTFANRKQEVVPTNGPLDRCALNVVRELGQARAALELKQVGCGWQVRPDLTTDGRVRIACEPQLQHGERQDWLRPSEDGTRFTLQGEVPRIRFPELAFEITLEPRETLIIGSNADARDMLGSAFFRVEVNGQPRQRVLVLRAGQGSNREAPEVTSPRRLRGNPSLAATAAQGRATPAEPR